ncbi:zeta toxin family protein [Streptomyces melanogenes]|uniref:zeta toxin family protein n=1 Tax=Streptomyces melanogenes TaxID=67326 RepID=UPI0037A8CD54
MSSSSPSQPSSIPAGLAPGAGRARPVLETTVLPPAVCGAVAQEEPVVVFVAGQGGSGKTFVMDVVHAALDRRGGAVRVERDAYKAAHPRYEEFLAEDVRTAGVRVRTDTYRWQAEVEARARAGRYDVVVEEAMPDPAGWRAAAAAYRRAGYRIEVVALAVPEAVSQLGVLDRYLRLADEGVGPRYVSWENHDACAAALPAVLADIEAGRLADRVTVVRRGAEVVYTNELDDGGRWIRPARAREALLAERLRPWDAAQTGAFRQQLADADRRAHDPRLPEDWALAVRGNAERAAAAAEGVRRLAQPRREAPGVDYHRLSADEHAWIFDELIVPNYLDDITPQDQPVALYVMGPQGAGKTHTTHVLRRSLRLRRPTRIEGGIFKSMHPDYWQLLQEQPRTASARIRADYRAWQERAEAYVRERRGDLLIEIAPDSVGHVMDSARRTRGAGYRVELLVLGVRAADSRLGTATRCAELARLGVAPRFTAGDAHDATFAVVADVVRAAEHDPATVASVSVIRRDLTAVYRNERTPAGDWVRAPRGGHVLEAEQQRPYTTAEAARFFATLRRVHGVLPQYRTDLVEIAALAWPLMPAHLQPRTLASPLTPARLPLPRHDVGYWAPSSLARAA